jgi:uncharacterized pyridoxamine 5'-phosphate oxidase family protein
MLHLMARRQRSLLPCPTALSSAAGKNHCPRRAGIRRQTQQLLTCLASKGPAGLPKSAKGSQDGITIREANVTLNLTSEQVWQEIEDNIFGVMGMVTADCEARTVGIVYVVREHKLYVGTDNTAWKARHIAQNPHVSMTIPIAKRIPFAPWVKIPSATITFSGTARVLQRNEYSPEITENIFRGMTVDDEKLAGTCVIEVTPNGDFVTYGVGIPLMQMRDPERARGRASVN